MDEVNRQLQLLSDKNDIEDSDMASCMKSLEAAQVKLQDTPLPLVGTQDEQTAFSTGLELLASWSASLRGAVAWQQRLDPTNTKEVETFLDHSLKLEELLSSETGACFPKFRNALAGSLVQALKTHLTEQVSSMKPFLLQFHRFLTEKGVEPTTIFTEDLLGDVSDAGEDVIGSTESLVDTCEKLHLRLKKWDSDTTCKVNTGTEDQTQEVKLETMCLAPAMLVVGKLTFHISEWADDDDLGSSCDDAIRLFQVLR